MKRDSIKRVIKTGTQVYGPLSDDSDWDFVMHKECARSLKELLEMLKVEVHSSHHIHPSYEGFYFSLAGYHKVQIIVAFDEREFETWKETTEDMKEISPILDRFERISTFKQIFIKKQEEKLWEGGSDEDDSHRNC